MNYNVEALRTLVLIRLELLLSYCQTPGVTKLAISEAIIESMSIVEKVGVKVEVRP